MPCVSPYDPFIPTPLKFEGTSVEDIMRTLRRQIHEGSKETFEIMAMYHWLRRQKELPTISYNETETKLRQTAQWWKIVLFECEIRDHGPTLFDDRWIT